MKPLHARLSLFAIICFFGTFCYALVGEKLAFGEEPSPASNTETTKAVALKDESGCFKCHSQLSGKAQVMEGTWAMDTHHNAGVSCVGCHGGNPDPSITMVNWTTAHVDVKDAKGNVVKFIGKASRKDQVQWCSSCHENPDKMETYTLSKEPVVGIAAEFLGSAHGRALFKEGNDKSASCVDCHGGHGAMKGSQITSLTHVKNVANMCGSCHSNEAYITPSLEKKGKSYEDHTAAYMQSVHANSIYIKNAVGRLATVATAITATTCQMWVLLRNLVTLAMERLPRRSMLVRTKRLTLPTTCPVALVVMARPMDTRLPIGDTIKSAHTTARSAPTATTPTRLNRLPSLLRLHNS